MKPVIKAIGALLYLCTTLPLSLGDYLNSDGQHLWGKPRAERQCNVSIAARFSKGFVICLQTTI